MQTGGVSAQFYVVYDNHFSTREVNSIPDSDDIPKEWLDLFKFACKKHFDDSNVINNSQPTIIIPNSTPIDQSSKPNSNLPAKSSDALAAPVQLLDNP